eukprot:m.11471 g.11471  ORF g.11471 m.11471 type:complete len:135 (+) comp23384_c1_seq2:51-455(+)
MSWEDEGFDPSDGFGAPADRWEGEDADLENVKESWDISSDEEKATDAAKPKETKTKEQRIFEKKEKRRLEELKQAEKAKATTKRTLTSEEEFAEKKHQEDLVRQSDLEMAEDLFGMVETVVCVCVCGEGTPGLF